MRTDLYAELYLWNKNVDALVRVLQRIELLDTCPAQLLRTREAQLEEIRSAMNIDLLNAALAEERIEQLRMSWRSGRGTSNSEQTEVN